MSDDSFNWTKFLTSIAAFMTAFWFAILINEKIKFIESIKESIINIWNWFNQTKLSLLQIILACVIYLILKKLFSSSEPEPEPSFPIDRWEFLWFRYTEDKRNPWGDLIAQTIKIELNFDEDWGKGIVDNSGLSNKVGFKASRTIRLNVTGRYNFKIGGDDGIRLYVYNDNLKETFLEINEWNDQVYSEFERTISLRAGEYKLLLEWYELHNEAHASFKLRELPRV